MNKSFTIFLAVLFPAGLCMAQTTLFQESFPNGQAELTRLTGDGVSQLQIDSTFTNPSGSYLVRLQAHGQSGVRPIMLVK